MNTDHLTIDYDLEMLKKRRPWYYVALILFLLSLLIHQPVGFLAALFALVVGLVPNLWYRHALHHLVVRQQASQQHLFFGEEVTLSISIENQKLLPLPWLQVENPITPPLAIVSRRVSRLQRVPQDALASTWLFWSFQRVTRHYRMLCQTRGYHVFGPVRLSSSDPFGWLECELTLPVKETLLVYPLIAPLETLGLSSVHPLGEYTSSRRFLEDPLRIAGVRDYLLGDDPRRIHWKATARAGALQSKIYEPSTLRRFLVLLDTWNYSHILKAADPEIQEFSITVAASFAVWALDEGYTVGLLTNSSMATSATENTLLPATREDSVPTGVATVTSISPPGVRVPFSRDHGQYERLLSTLARLVPAAHTPIERCIEMEDTMFPPGTTVILVSAASTLNEATVERLLDLRRGGVAVHLALTGNTENTKTETYDLPIHFLGGREKWHELIRTVGDGGVPGTSSTSLQLD
ncbi:MAG: DUF58 domain-containing protein [Chloroflexi bacterium]|nr:DUF58 domain-containing protein [Chloroflexota bacterium]